MILAEVVGWSRPDIAKASSFAEVRGVVLGDPLCERRTSRDGSTLEELLMAARKRGLQTTVRSPLYLIGAVFDQTLEQLAALTRSGLIDMVMLRSLGLSNALRDTGAEICWDLFGFGRAARPINLDSLRLIAEYGVTCIETDLVEHVPAIESMELHTMLAMGYEHPASIRRSCFQTAIGSTCSDREPACLAEQWIVETRGEPRYALDGHILRDLAARPASALPTRATKTTYLRVSVGAVPQLAQALEEMRAHG